eukprot:jgi/Chlat1/3113/Chrsp21S03344
MMFCQSGAQMGGTWIGRLWGLAGLGGASEFKAIILGLDGAGKTTALYKLHLGETVVTQPTVGSNVERISVRNGEVVFEVWDVGGQEKLRASWPTYFQGAHAVMLVVDSTDRTRIAVARDELLKLLKHEDLVKPVLLVYANKQDLRNAMTVAEISDALSLHTVTKHSWHIQPCCAITGEGLKDGFRWLVQQVQIRRMADGR